MNATVCFVNGITNHFLASPMIVRFSLATSCYFDNCSIGFSLSCQTRSVQHRIGFLTNAGINSLAMTLIVIRFYFILNELNSGISYIHIVNGWKWNSNRMNDYFRHFKSKIISVKKKISSLKIGIELFARYSVSWSTEYPSNWKWLFEIKSIIIQSLFD